MAMVSGLAKEKQSQSSKNGDGTVKEIYSSRCSNCYRKYTKTCLPTRQFYYEFYENGVKVTKNVQISEAIKEIFEWRLFGFSENAIEDYFRSAEQFRVCGNICGVAIAKLYGAIKVFDSLAHSDSVMTNFTTKTLEKFISYATSHSLVGSPISKDKLTPNLLTRKSKSKKEYIGKEILNRQITQHVKVEAHNTNQNQPLAEDPLIRILDPNDYQVESDVPDNDPLGDVQQHVVPNLNLINLAEKKMEPIQYSSSVDDAGVEEGDDWVEGEEVEVDTLNISKPYLCQLCGAGLNSRQGLRTHELLTHKISNGKEKIFVCPHCEKEFYFEYLLKNHLACHAPVREFACTSCELKFKGRIALRQHVKDVHDTLERKYSCKICPNKSFKHKRTLWDHMKSHHGNKGSKVIFSCKYGCGSTSSRSRSLLHHHRICLKRPREDQVDAALKSIGANLPEEELEKLDDGGKRMKIYSCIWDCGKTFTTKPYRNRHSKKMCKKARNQVANAISSKTEITKAMKPVLPVKDVKSKASEMALKKLPKLTPAPKFEPATPVPSVQEPDPEEEEEMVTQVIGDDNEVEGMIEVETVFDETIIIP